VGGEKKSRLDGGRLKEKNTGRKEGANLKCWKKMKIFY